MKHVLGRLKIIPVTFQRGFLVHKLLQRSDATVATDRRNHGVLHYPCHGYLKNLSMLPLNICRCHGISIEIGVSITSFAASIAPEPIMLMLPS